MEELEIISIESDDKSRKKRKRSRSRYEDEDRNNRRKKRHRDKSRDYESDDDSSEIVEVFSDIRHKRKKGKRRKKKKRRRSKSYSSPDDKYSHIKKERRINGIKEEIVNVSDSDYDDSYNKSENSRKYKRSKNKKKDYYSRYSGKDSERSRKYKKFKEGIKDYSHSSKNYSSSVKRRKYHSKDTDRKERERSRYNRLEDRQSDRKRFKHSDHREYGRETSEKFNNPHSNKERSTYETLEHRKGTTETSKILNFVQNYREKSIYNNIDQRQNERKGIKGQNEQRRFSNDNFDIRLTEREINKYGSTDHKQSEKGKSENIDHIISNMNSTKYGNNKGRPDEEKTVDIDRGQNNDLQEIDVEDNVSAISPTSTTNVLTLKNALKRIGGKDKERTENTRSPQENTERELGSSLYKDTEEILRWISNSEESTKNVPFESDITSSVENEMHQDADIDIITEIRNPHKQKPSNPSHTQSGREIVNVNNERQKNNLNSLNKTRVSNPLHHPRGISQGNKEHDSKSNRTLKSNQGNEDHSSKNRVRCSDSERPNLSILANKDKSLEMNNHSTSHKEKRLPSREGTDFVSILEKFPNLQKQMELASSYNCASSNKNTLPEIVVNKSFMMNDSKNKQSQLTSQEEIVLCDDETPPVNVHSHTVSSKGVPNTKESHFLHTKEKSSQNNRPVNFYTHDKDKQPICIEKRINEKQINGTTFMSESIGDKNIVKIDSQNRNFGKPLNKFIINSQDEIVLCDTEIHPDNGKSCSVSSKGVAGKNEKNLNNKEKSLLYNRSDILTTHDKTDKHSSYIRDRINEKEIRNSSTTLLSEEEIVLCETESPPVARPRRAVSSSSANFNITEKSSQNDISFTYSKHDKDETSDTTKNRNNDKEIENDSNDTLSNFFKQYKTENSLQIITASKYIVIHSSDCQGNHSNKINTKQLQSVRSEERKTKQVKDSELRLSPNKQDQAKNDLADENRSQTLLNPAKSWSLRVAAAKERHKNKVNLLNKNMVAKIHHNSSTATQININESIKTSSSNVGHDKTRLNNEKAEVDSSTVSEINEIDNNADSEKNLSLPSSNESLDPSSLENKCATSEDSGKLFKITNVQGNIIFNNDSNTSDAQSSGRSNAEIKKENTIVNSSVNSDRAAKQIRRVSDIKEEIVFSNEIHSEIYDQVDSKAFVRSMLSNEYLDKDSRENKASLHQSIRAEGLDTVLCNDNNFDKIQASTENISFHQDNRDKGLNDTLDNDNNFDRIQNDLPESEDLSIRAHNNESVSNSDMDVNYSESENGMQNNLENSELRPDSPGSSTNQSGLENSELRPNSPELSTNQSRIENSELRPDSPESNHSSTMLKIESVWTTAIASNENKTNYDIPEDLLEVVEIGRVEVTKISAHSFSIKKESSEARNYYVSHTDIENCPMCQQKLNSDQFKFNPSTLILTMVCKCTLTIYQLINPEKYKNMSIR